MLETVDKIEQARIERMSKRPCDNESDDKIALHCAEECNELVKTCLKLVRYFWGDPSLRDDLLFIFDSLNEEVADVIMTLCNLFEADLVDSDKVAAIAAVKATRYENLVNQKER